MEFVEDLRIYLRRWLGIAKFQKRTLSRLTRLEDKYSMLEEAVAISQEDLDRLNAATSRIAARVNSLLDQIDALGTGNDDAVRAEQQLADVQAASSQLRPVLDQLEALGADATNVVPEPTPDQVPVEPGPDVAPVENPGPPSGSDPVFTPGDGTVVTDPGTAPGVSPDAPLEADPGTPTPGSPDGDVVFNPDGTAPGETTTEPAPAGDGSVVTAPEEQVSGTGGGETVPGPSGDEAAPTER